MNSFRSIRRWSWSAVSLFAPALHLAWGLAEPESPDEELPEAPAETQEAALTDLLVNGTFNAGTTAP